MNKIIRYLITIFNLVFVTELLAISQNEDSKISSDLGIKEINDLKRKFVTETAVIPVNKDGRALEADFVSGSTTVDLPVTLYFQGDSCAIACLTDQIPKKAYVIEEKGNIIGFIKIKGSYFNNSCVPYDTPPGYNISLIQDFSYLCYKFYTDNYKTPDSPIISAETGIFFKKEK